MVQYTTLDHWLTITQKSRISVGLFWFVESEVSHEENNRMTVWNGYSSASIKLEQQTIIIHDIIQ